MGMREDLELLASLLEDVSKDKGLVTKAKKQGVKPVSKAVAKTKTVEPPEFQHQGTAIVLPVGMDYDEAIKQLMLKREEEETYVSVYEEIPAFPLDGAFMLMKVLQRRYGWASPVPKKGFFGDTPPTMVSLEIAPGETTQVIWGEFQMPGIEGRIATHAQRKKGQFIFVITGKVKKKHQSAVKEIADEVRERIKTESVYKGMPIKLDTDENGDVDMMEPPSFLDMTRVNEEELILPAAIRAEVEASLFTPVEHTEMCRKHKIPLKRGVLLEGPYGTGKTLTAYVTAKKCQANGWTFIYVSRVTGLDEAFCFARQYSPAVIFAEDIDRAVSGEDRTVEIDDVLNSIDGIESKGSEIITILTSNDVKSINRAMLRPGRLDAVISVQPPDAEAAQKLIRLYARNLIAVNENLEEAGRVLAGQIPAVIREVVERAKLHAINRLKEQAGDLVLTGTDLTHAALAMKHHLALLAPKSDQPETAETQFGTALKRVVSDAIGSNGSGSVYQKMEELPKQVVQAMRNS